MKSDHNNNYNKDYVCLFWLTNYGHKFLLHYNLSCLKITAYLRQNELCKLNINNFLSLVISIASKHFIYVSKYFETARQIEVCLVLFCFV